MKRIIMFSAALGVWMMSSSALIAGDITKDLNISSFSGIESSASCEIVLENSSGFTAKVTCDEKFQDYVEVYAKNNLLHIEMNTASMPADLKKIWKTKDTREPQFKVVLGIPSATSIELGGDARLTSNLDKLSCKFFSLSLSGRAKATGLNIDATKVSVSASGNSVSGICAAGDSLIVNASGSANVNIRTSSINSAVSASRNSSVTLSGSSKWLGISCGGACAVNSMELESSTADVKLEGGATASIKSLGKVSVDLKGSRLFFKGPGVFEVLKVTNSSIEPAQE
ncbi:MAG: GIN domain-containing protein [Candidatus Cryptobacteroides sp.]